MVSNDFHLVVTLVIVFDEKKIVKVAVTGVVLIKKNYMIGNADDVTRIPRMVFKEDSKAMFIPKDDEPWFCQLTDLITHPEFDYSTRNTLALIEIKMETGQRELPFKPVCWPHYSFNASNQLYAIGFTDEHRLLEKIVYKLQYVKKKSCDQYYDKAGYKATEQAPPVTYHCGYAEHLNEDCSWENGMLMASNASGKWTLIGFGVLGPGCAAPARFIDVSTYLPWVQSATDQEQIDDQGSKFSISLRRTLDTAVSPKK